MTTPFVLASNSPRRREILGKLEIPIEIVPSEVEERYSEEEDPESVVNRISFEKARSVAERFPHRLIIGADTVVVIDDRILGKPRDLRHAGRMLRSLSGKTHTVITGVALVLSSRGEKTTFSERTDVTFVNLDDRMIEYYLEHGEPMDKAGGYAIQDWSACFVETISGCYNNVMGFPLSRFVQTLRNPRMEKRFGPYNWFGKVWD